MHEKLIGSSLIGTFITSGWAFLGIYHKEIASMCAIVGAVVCVLTYVRGRKGD